MLIVGILHHKRVVLHLWHPLAIEMFLGLSALSWMIVLSQGSSPYTHIFLPLLLLRFATGGNILLVTALLENLVRSSVLLVWLMISSVKYLIVPWSLVWLTFIVVIPGVLAVLAAVISLLLSSTVVSV